MTTETDQVMGLPNRLAGGIPLVVGTNHGVSLQFRQCLPVVGPCHGVALHHGIANDVGDLTGHVIPGKNGYIVNPYNPVEVAAAILSAFATSSTIREVGPCHGMALHHETI